jgi:hypothetical protein
MTVAGTIAYKFLAHTTFLHVYTLTGMPVSATQVDSTKFNYLYATWGTGRGGHETGMYLEKIRMQGRKWHACATCKCIHIAPITCTCR